ncbi:MAG: hypothetical protein M1836_004647 [Candelina mexicana]|nr:MAG: hypothetical protein M1836_004647 [Candelina mexicana]
MAGSSESPLADKGSSFTIAQRRVNFKCPDYNVGWICALPKLLAARVLLDEEHEPPSYNTRYDRNTYICGGVPTSEDIYLGDVVVRRPEERELRELSKMAWAENNLMQSAPISTLPRIDPDFVGRDDILQQMDEQFTKSNFVSLVGLGGIGKTAIAVQYSHNYHQRIPESHTFWVNGSTRQNFDNAYRRIAKELKIPECDDPLFEHRKEVPRELDRDKTRPWIMIIDDADDYGIYFPPPDGALGETEQSEYLAYCLPAGAENRGRVIVTTRNAKLGQAILDSSSTPIQVPELASADARILLRSRVPTEKWEDEAADMLLKELDDIPLAITLVGALVKHNKLTSLKSCLGKFCQMHLNVQDVLSYEHYDARGQAAPRLVQRFLTKNFVSTATSDYAWLQELDEAGYSSHEIAELLLEDISDSPWIYFTPRMHARYPIQTIFHVPGCAHQNSSNKQPQTLLLVEELCGIGGVVPSSRDMSTWHGTVTFMEQSSVSVVTYATDPAVTQQSRNDLVVRISNVLANFCAAAAAVQSAELCCDSFTVLLRIQNHLELRRVKLRHALTMASNINFVLQGNNTEAAVQQCVQAAEYILQELGVSNPKTASNLDLHYCALAAQFLCSAFLSYVQAHVGSINPFFLNKPQRKMILLGNQLVPGEFSINAELVELTCLAEMTQQLVFAFSIGTSYQELRLESRGSQYDVLTNAEDLLDTWGPGYFIYSKENPNKIHAVAIGGGFVSLIDSKTLRFHWAKGKLPVSASRAAFDPYTKMRIGTAVSINEECCIDEAVYRESSFCALKPLGTREVFWEAQERQAGLQGGQYLIGTYSQTWKKIPGTTLKQCTLQQSDWRLIPFLEQSWGLQVSFCTSVARRVSLRELVTDLFPMFVSPLEEGTWQELVTSHNIMKVFTEGNIFAWLLTLSSSLQFYVLKLVRTILEQLQHTGLDRRNATLVIAWPQEGDIERGLEIPCRAETCWAQVIADAEDCATFAYVTSRCLETNHVKCRGNLRAWQNMSKMLVTEMSPSGPEGQPLLATNSATTILPAATVSTAANATNRWELEDQKTYYIKKLDSLLRVKVERPSLANNDVTHLVVATSKIPQGLWKRLLLKGEERMNRRIREKQAKGDRAELVVVRAGLIGV